MKIKYILWVGWIIAILVVWGNKIFIQNEHTFLNWILFIGGFTETIRLIYTVLKKKYEK